MTSVSTSTDPVDLEYIDASAISRWFVGFPEELGHSEVTKNPIQHSTNEPDIVATSEGLRRWEDDTDNLTIDVEESDCIPENSMYIQCMVLCGL